jgi:hypothetical protein
MARHVISVIIRIKLLILECHIYYKLPKNNILSVNTFRSIGYAFIIVPILHFTEKYRLYLNPWQLSQVFKISYAKFQLSMCLGF